MMDVNLNCQASAFTLQWISLSIIYIYIKIVLNWVTSLILKGSHVYRKNLLSENRS